MFDRIKFFLSEAWSFLQPFVKQLMTNAGKTLAIIALNTVKEVANTMGDADGEAKRAAAFASIKGQLKEAGLSLGTSMINAAIEAAVIKMKAEG